MTTKAATAPLTAASLATAMFTVSDQDAALAFYRDRLGWEVRYDEPVGVEVADVLAEHARLTEVGGIDLDAPRQVPGGPLLFALRDPDGNSVWVAPAAG